MKYILGIIVLLFAAGVWLYTHPEQIADAALSSADMSSDDLFSETAQGLLEICSEPKAQRKLDLSREECEQKILAREPICMEQVKENWPDAVSDLEQLNEVAEFYSSCLMSAET